MANRFLWAVVRLEGAPPSSSITTTVGCCSRASGGELAAAAVFCCGCWRCSVAVPGVWGAM